MKPSWILLLAGWLGYIPRYLGNKPLCYPSGNCYTVLLTELPFYNAAVSCGLNGSFTTMRNEQEKEETLQSATHFQHSRNVSEFWIGLHLQNNCTNKDNTLYGFIWISGEEKADITMWDQSPKGSCTTKKRCVALQSRKNSTISSFGNLIWFWKNVNCNKKKLPSICRFPRQFSPTEDGEIFYPPPTDQPTKSTSATIQTMERISSTIKVLCKEFRGNETITCEVENIPYSCNDTHCFCGHLDYKGGGYGLRRCQESLNESCLGQCIKYSNISCACRDHQTSCDRGECTINTATIAISASPVVHTAPSSPLNDDENLFENLVLPLILGLVALGILIMLVWGGVQMCVRKRKPKRKKSIVPVVEPDAASDTDSTDNSSSDEEGDSQDMAEMA